MTYMLDVTLTLLAEAPRPLKHRDRVRFHIGTSEIMGRVILLDRDEVQPGEEVFAQLHLEESAIAAPQDRCAAQLFADPDDRRRRDPGYLAGQAPAPSSARAGAAHHLTGWHLQRTCWPCTSPMPSTPACHGLTVCSAAPR